MRFSVVIPTMRREAILEATLASLERCDPPPDEVIIVDSDDDGSSQSVVTAFDHAVSHTVRYVRTTLLPGDETCFHLFEAASHEAVAEACRLAGLEAPRIVPAVE